MIVVIHMANHTSAKKYIRKTVKRTLINKSRNSKIKTFVKKVLAAIGAKQLEESEKAFQRAQSEIMRGVTKGVLKLNTASRKVSALSKKIKQMKIKGTAC